MQNVRSSLIARPDTLLGICQAVGEDFGFNANWLRVAFAAIVILNMETAVGAYLALGVLVVATRLLYPNRRAAKVATAPAEVVDEPKADVAPAAQPLVERELIAA